MEFKIRKRHILAAAMVLLLSGGFFPAVRVVSFANAKSFREKVYSAAALGGFCISYTHSVNKGRVHDYVGCTDDGFFLVDVTEFVSYGAGIPEEYEFFDSSFASDSGTYRISGLNRKLASIRQAVGVTADHSVKIKDDEFFLKDFFEKQTSLEIRIRRVSLFDYFTARRFL